MENTQYEKKLRNMKIIKIFKKILMYLVLGAGAFITIFPFYYMIVLSTKSREGIFTFPPPMWFGTHFMENLSNLLEKLPIFRALFNSMFVAGSQTILVLFFCSLGGYAFAKFEFKGREKLFGAMLATLMIPQLLSIIPWFILMKQFGWINTYLPLIVPMIANPFGIFLMRQFMEDLPDSILDAARIDGAGEFEIFIKVVLPISLPALGTLAIFTFLGSWNQFLQALLVLQQKEMYTLPVALSKLAGKVSSDAGASMVGTVLATMPIVIVFIIASKQFISGMTAGATKG
ncbi:MAG: carbohydrate ABC transporter permease [Fusobacteriota bacterium]